MFYISLFDIKAPEDDVKKTETCRSISPLHVTVYILILEHCRYYLLNRSLTLDMNIISIPWRLLKTDQLMRYGEIITDSSEIHIRSTQTLRTEGKINGQQTWWYTK